MFRIFIDFKKIIPDQKFYSNFCNAYFFALKIETF